MFRDREDAARRLAQKLQGRAFRDPLVLAIPRGGVVTGAVLAQELGAALDVVLARKLRAPDQPECALGAVSETGGVFLNLELGEAPRWLRDYLAIEQAHQRAEIDRRRRLYRGIRPAAPLRGRTVLVTDDGIATGATMIAALQVARAQRPHELIVAAPVAPANRVEEVGHWCDELVCLLVPKDFWAVGQFYADFRTVEDAEVIELLRTAVSAPEVS